MNVLYLTISKITIPNGSGIYNDLLNKFVVEGHRVFVASALERKEQKRTYIEQFQGGWHLHILTPNIFQTGSVEKGIAYLSLEFLFKRAIKKYWREEHFDLILYATPPPTLGGVIGWTKEYYGARSYLMLKDVFPQNAVDLGMMATSSRLYKFFKKKEKQTYMASDAIGCMSPANVDYLLQHNSYLNPDRVEVCPNAIDLSKENTFLQETVMDRQTIRNLYAIPGDALVFVYGGNLGKPQGIPFLLEVLSHNIDRTDCFFVIVGKGTEYPLIEQFVQQKGDKNVLLIDYLPQQEYNTLLSACDVGLIFLDYRFTIPNFPSRLLGYLQSKMPILIASDTVTDMGQIAQENGFGRWAPSYSTDSFTEQINFFLSRREQIPQMGEMGYRYMQENYSVEVAYNRIVSKIDSKDV